MKQCILLTFMVLLVTGLTNAQTSKIPAMKPAVKAPLKISRVAISPNVYKFGSDNGHIDISHSRSKPAKDDVTTTTTESKAAMCLTREEVNGQKIENEQIIADGSKALQILPGGVIDVSVLLQSGEFKYMKMNNRKKISISTTSNLAKKTREEVVPGPNKNNNIEDELRAKVHALTRPSNLNGMPNGKSVSDVSMSTLEENTGLNIGASFFYMGASASNNFRFSSTKFRYMYLYQFEQECLPVIANGVSSVADLFKDEVAVNNNWLYIREVKYGRRLYVLLESEYDLQKYNNKFKGNMDWLAVSGELKVDSKNSSFSGKTNIRIITQGGTPIAVTDRTKIQKTLDDYFNAPYKEMDIVPLSYKLTYMDGEPVSMISNAFLDGKNCLDQDKIKVRISEIEVKQEDDSKQNEEVYGSANIFLYNTSGKIVYHDGKTENPSNELVKFPTGTFSFGTKEAPLILDPKQPKVFALNQQGKYTEMFISNLDMVIEIKPVVHEKDNVFNKDDQYVTEDRMKKSIREMLLQGTTTAFFEFRRKGSVIVLKFEIIPI